MKKKNRKQRKRRQSARHERTKEKKVGRASPPWLRMLSSGIEEGPNSDVSREWFTQRNGRRQPQDLDLYIPEDNSRSR